MSSRPPRVVHVVAAPESLVFFEGLLAAQGRRGIEVHLVAPEGTRLRELAAQEGALPHGLAIDRGIAPLADLLTLLRLVRLLRRLEVDAIAGHMSKAGILAMLAGAAAGVPVRIYQNQGMAAFSASGLSRLLLRASERIACAVATRATTVSPSVRFAALREGLATAEKLVVLGAGSFVGVDARGHFDPEVVGAGARQAVRAAAGIPPGAPVVGYAGRLSAVKGVRELLRAWSAVARSRPEAHLLVVGGEDDRAPISAADRRTLSSSARIHLAGQVDDVAPYYSAMDVLCLPSHHEGMPNVVLEAAAMRLPVVATAVPGNLDAVVDGITGTLVPPGDDPALAGALLAYLDDPGLVRRHGDAARDRVLADFPPERIRDLLLDEYDRLLGR